MLQQVIESSVNVTVGDHGLCNVNGRKSLAPGAMGDLTQEFRGYGRRNPPPFFEEVFAYGARKLLDSVKPFEQGSLRPRHVTGRFRAGNPQQGSSADGGLGLLSLPPRILQKIVFHGASLTPWPTGVLSSQRAHSRQCTN